MGGHAAGALVFAGIVLVVLWAMMSSGASPLRAAPSALAAGVVLLVFLATFGMLALDLVGRLAAVVIGATTLLLVGSFLGFYQPPDALHYLWTKLDTLVLLGGISVVTALLAEAGFFTQVAYRVVRRFGENRRAVMILLCLLTYGLSAFMNNLATILLIIPLSLIIADALDLDPATLVLAEVIASNLGGASTMIGDFPNMLIATETGLPFHEFLIHLAPVGLLQLGILLAFLAPKFPVGASRRRRRQALVRQLAAMPHDRNVGSRGQAILALMVVGFAVCGELGVSPAVVAAAGAGAAFLLGGVSPAALVRRMCLDDVAFFACLFVMVGAVAASGILGGAGRMVSMLWGTSPVWGAIGLAWGAALLTCVFNAGPTIALLLPLLVAGFNPTGADEAVWWALSLGVCAGSSATLTGATAGPVAASLLEKHGVTLTFNRFARTGVPIMFAFLIVSSCYLALVVR